MMHISVTPELAYDSDQLQSNGDKLCFAPTFEHTVPTWIHQLIDLN